MVLFFEIKEYLFGLGSRDSCFRPPGTNGKSTACKCMKWVTEEEDSPELERLASYMVYWAGLDGRSQTTLIIEWTRCATVYAAGQRCGTPSFVLPISLGGDNLPPARFVCQNAIQNIFNIGVKKWNSSTEPTEHPLHHGLKNKTGSESNRGKGNKEVHESLHAFFEELKKESTPFATRIIRDVTGTTTRDDDLDAICLPPHMSKHRCYAQWCWSRGWKVEKSSKQKGIYKQAGDRIRKARTRR